MTKRKLPIGIQSFRKIREDGCYYVDKTAYAWRMVNEGSHYFLSRPRRFGKSLFLDTLKNLFEGNEALFEGLDIHDKWDWSKRHPVVRLSFSGGNFKEPGDLQTNLLEQLADAEELAGTPSGHTTAPGRFRRLVRALHQRTGQPVAVLVDEYDKPILDALDEPDMARANRDALRGFYGTIKDCDEHVRFAFLTGVSKFSQAGLFSGLNNLIDITLDANYSAICGYTDPDLDRVFAPELPGLDRDEIRRWYNGYNWLGAQNVYNPFDLLLLFHSREFRPHWFGTGTPTFLIDLLLERGSCIPSLDEAYSHDDLMSRFDVDSIQTEALLFQSGYLTIRGLEEERYGETWYRLDYPNYEVRKSLNECLLKALAPDASVQLRRGRRLRELLRANDFAGIEALLRAFFASIPYEWHTRNDIARYEGYYASVLYAWFAASGLDVVLEDSTSGGRLDMAVRFDEQIYLFEFKVVELAPDGAALAQIRERGYADKYRASGQSIHLVGVEFSRESRNLVAFETEPA